MRTFEIKDGKECLPVSCIAPVLREDYRYPPWNEDRMCPNCKGPDDFGPLHAYGTDGSEHCPHCKSKLVPFWSDERLARYLETAQQQPNFLFLSVYEDGKFASWLWGYDTDRFTLVTGGATGFYIDVFAAMPQFRGSGWERSASVFRKGLAHIRKKDFDRIEDIIICDSLPVYASMFLWLLHHQWQQGCRYLGTRTHTAAGHVKSLLRMLGFHHVPEIASDDPGRQYWLSTVCP